MAEEVSATQAARAIAADAGIEHDMGAVGGKTFQDDMGPGETIETAAQKRRHYSKYGFQS